MDKKLIPNSTQIPNLVLDLLVPEIPEAEGKCLLYICRRTYGFHKDEDKISFSQFADGIKSRDGKVLDKGTGLVRRTVATGLKNLAKAGAITVEKSNTGNIYRINLDMDIDEVVQKMHQCRKDAMIRAKNAPKQVSLLHIQKKEKESETKVNASGLKEPSAHTKFIKFFDENCKRVRGTKPIITGKDGRNLKRVLDLKIVGEQELEQICLYFLSDQYYKKFAPSISTFLSAGILNGLANSLKNRPTFWKEMDNYMTHAFGRQAVRSDSFADRLIQMKAALGVKYAIAREKTYDE